MHKLGNSCEFRLLSKEGPAHDPKYVSCVVYLVEVSPKVGKILQRQGESFPRKEAFRAWVLL